MKYIEYDNKIECLDNNKVIGYIIFDKVDGVYDISKIYVDSNYRGYGIGRELFNRCIGLIGTDKVKCSCSFAKKLWQNK